MHLHIDNFFKKNTNKKVIDVWLCIRINLNIILILFNFYKLKYYTIIELYFILLIFIGLAKRYFCPKVLMSIWWKKEKKIQ